MSAAGDVDYRLHGAGYTSQRRADPRIAALIHAALGDARSVLNVGAGAGSYEPEDRHVIAIEPSAAMRAQRPPHLAPAIDAAAEALPQGDRSVDAAMALFTVHQWRDVDLGLREVRRVARGPVVVMTADGDAFDRFWLAAYAPELMEHERRRFPAIERIAAGIGKRIGGRGGEGTGERVDVMSIPIPADCSDGFNEAFYARPEAFLDPAVRRSQSAWSFLDAAVVERIVARLAADLESGAWDRRFGEWRRRPTFDGSLRLVVGRPATEW